ncbi:MAG: hypothetical protein KKG99_04710 [Bacteroidetes bacterium]|nr:hypothetical protein [Bacteroidota bacterium]
MKTTSLLLAEKIHDQLYPENEIKYKSNDFALILDNISLKNPDISKFLRNYQSTEQQISFFKKDKEMLIKFPDIWKIQLNLEENKLKEIKQRLIEFGTENKLEMAAIFNSIDKETNKLTDLFK